jgi:hypothetical protein
MIQLALQFAGAAAVVIGVLAIGFGSIWAPGALEVFSSSTIGRAFQTFVPFLPIFLIMLGAFLLVKSRQ